MRDRFVESLESFRNLTKGAVTVILYTFLSQDFFTEKILDHPALSQLKESNDDLIERVIFLEGFKLGVNDTSDQPILID